MARQQSDRRSSGRITRQPSRALSSKSRRRLFHPVIEQLEDRQLLSVRWINPGGGDWDTPGNWDANRLPGIGDDVLIDLSGITVTHNSGAAASIFSLQQSNGTLTWNNGSLRTHSPSGIHGNFNLSAGSLAVFGNVAETTSGTLDVSNASSSVTFNWSSGTITGGTVTVGTGVTFNLISTSEKDLLSATLRNSGPNSTLSAGIFFVDQNGTFDNLAGTSFHQSGGFLWPGNTGAAINEVGGTYDWSGGQIRSGPLTNKGTLSLTGAGGWDLNGRIDNTGRIVHMGTGSLVLSGAVNNQASGVYEFRADAAITGVGNFNNVGTILKSAGSGEASFQDAHINNQGGTIEAQSGQLTVGTRSSVSTGGTFKASQGALLSLVASAADDGPFYSGMYTGSGAGRVELSRGRFNTDVTGATFALTAGLFQWTGGSIFSAPARPFTNTGTMTLSGANDKGLANLLINTGTIIQKDTGSLVMFGAGTITNQAGGVYEFQSDAAVIGNTGTFNNSGILRKSAGTGVSRLGQPVPPTGGDLYFNHLVGSTVDVRTGTLRLDKTRGSSTGATWNALPGAKLELIPNTDSGANFGGTYTGSGGGRVELSGGSFVTSDPGATFNMTAGLFQWTGGTIYSAPTRPFINAGTMAISGDADKALSAVIVNRGTMIQSGSGHVLNIATGQGSSLDNQPGAIYDFIGTGTQEVTNFTNRGTVLRSQGAGAAMFTSNFNHAGGTIDVRAGTIRLDQIRGTSTGAMFTVASGSKLQIIGNVFAPNYSGTYTGSGSGVVELDGSFESVGTGATVNMTGDLLHWVGGTIGGSAPFTNAGTMTISGAADKALRAVVINTGTVIQSDSGHVLDIAAGQGSRFDNQPGAIYDFIGTGTQEVSNFNNRGIVRRSRGAGEGKFTRGFNSLGGTIEVQAGTLNLAGGGLSAGGAFSISAGAVLNISGGLTFTGNYTGGGAGRIELSGGDFFAYTNDTSTSVSINFGPGVLHWTGGTLGGGGCFSGPAGSGCGSALTNAGSMIIEGPNAKAVGNTIINTGTILDVGPGDLILQVFFHGQTIDNRAGATFELRGDVGLLQGGAFLNAGTLTKTAGTNTALLDADLSSSATGRIMVHSGRLKFNRGHGGTSTGGEFDVDAGAVFEIAGNQTWSGTFTGTGPGTVELSGVIFSGPSPAVFNFPHGEFQWTTGQLVCTCTNQGEITIAGPAGHFMRSVFTNAGTIIHSGTGDLVVNANTRFMNQGLYDLQTDASIVSPNDGSGGNSPFTNSGFFRKSNGLGTSSIRHDGQIRAIVFDNTGTAEALSGTLSFQDPVVQASGTTLTAGTWKISKFATLTIPSAANFTINKAVVTLDGPASNFINLNSLANNQGNFTVTGARELVTAGAFTNNGDLTVGPNAKLTVRGDFTNATAQTLHIQISDRPVTGLFGQVNVTGRANLLGKLDIRLLNGFIPPNSDKYEILHYASQTGNFAQITGLAQNFTADVQGTKVVLTSIVSGLPALAVDPFMVPDQGRSGENVTVTYTVRNPTPIRAAGDWTDSLYLSNTGTFTPDALLIRRIDHHGGLDAGATYSQTITAPLPGVIDGTYRVFVFANSRGTLAVSDRSIGSVVSTNVLRVSPPSLAFGTTTRGNIKTGQDAYFRLDVPAGGDVVLQSNFAVPLEAEFFVRYRVLPDRSSFDFTASNLLELQRQLTIASPQAGPYYVLVHGREGAGGGQAFDITPQHITFAVNAVSPNSGANVGKVTTTIHGTGFTPNTTASLINSSGRVVTTAMVRFADPNTLFATLDLRGLSAASYDVQVRDGDHVSVLSHSFAVTAGQLGRVEVQISSPGRIRAGLKYSARVDYENVGQTDAVAPLLLVTADNAVLKLPDQDAYQGSQMYLVGINHNGPAGILPPGSRGSILLDFIASGATTFRVFGGIADTAVNWTAVKSQLKPALMPDTAWNAIFANFLTRVGNKIGDLQARLADDATYLSQLGEYTPDASRLVRFELQQADDFGAISEQYTSGHFGSNVPDPTDLQASADASGNVTIRLGSKVRSFNRQADGTYRAAPGDFATLTRPSGGFRVRETNGLVTMFTANGKLSFIEDANGNRTTANYTGGLLTSMTDSFGDTLSLAYNAQGHVSRVTDPVGRVTTYSYDTSGENLLSISGPQGTTTYHYVTGRGPALGHAIDSVTYLDGTHLFFEYDDRGRLTRTSRDGGADALSFTRDNFAGLRIQDAQGATTLLQLNDFGNLAQAQNAIGQVLGAAFDRSRQPTKVTFSGLSGSLAYDQNGNPKQVVDPLGQELQLNFDPVFSRLTTLQDPRGNPVGYSRDSRGNLTAITYTDGTIEQFQYDSSGNVVDYKNRRGNTVHFVYDTHNLLLRQEFSDGTVYSFTYDSHRNLASATDRNGTTSFVYDAADRMVRVTYPGGAFLAYTYDSGNRRTRMVDRDGNAVNYQLDAAGRLSRMTDGTGALIVAYTYDASGRLAREDKGNHTSTTYGYDPEGRPTTITQRAPDNSIQAQLSYTYNELGLPSQVQTLQGMTRYSYDATGQLTSVAMPNGRVITYAYDPAGNRTVVTDTGVVTSYATNNLNEYTAVGSDTLRYDPDGNVVSRTRGGVTTSLTYDNLGRLTGINAPGDQWTFSYNALGQRIASTHNGARTDFLIDPFGFGDVVSETSTAGSIRYVSGLGLVSRKSAGGNPEFYNFDVTGNTIGLTDAAGRVQQTFDYGPFGDLSSSSAPTANRFGFSGRWGVENLHAGASDFDLMRQRWYDPQLGRFGSLDPIGIRSGDFNWYRYVSNTATFGVDPSGLAGPIPGGGGPDWSQWWTENNQPQPPTGRPINPAAPASNLGERGRFGRDLRDIATKSRVLAANTRVAAALRATGKVFGAFAKPLAVLGSVSILLSTPASADDGSSSNTAFGNDVNILDSKLGAAANLLSLVTPQTAAANFVAQGLRWIPGFDEGVQSLLWPLATIGIPNQDVLGPRTLDLLGNSISGPVFSSDPNNIVGPDGAGDQHFVHQLQTLAYTINFENKPTATAPAQTVVVTQQLDANLDWSTFEVGDFGFGDTTVHVPQGRNFYHTRVNLAASPAIGGSPLIVDVTAGIDLLTGLVKWTFTSLDPATLDSPSNPLAGFLPPDKTAPQGEGFVSYAVRPKANLSTGARLDAKATIVFDANAPLATAPIFNTIDAAPPTSTVGPLPAITTTPSFTVTWSGTDDPGGSGIASFDIFVSSDGGPFALFLQGTTLTSATFNGAIGHTYAFYSVATDNVGHREAIPTAGQASTTTKNATVGDPNTLFVTALYRDVLGRAPDSVGLAFWIGLLGTGASRYQVVHGFWTSAEHRGIQVDQFYATLFHRPPDAPGRAAWINALVSGLSEDDVQKAFLSSVEYISAHADNETFVNALYADVLGRQAEPAGRASWLKALQSGATRDAVALGFLTSGEKSGQVVDRFYLDLLHRPAEAAGRQNWLAVLVDHRATGQQVGETVLVLDEFFARAQAG